MIRVSVYPPRLSLGVRTNAPIASRCIKLALARHPHTSLRQSRCCQWFFRFALQKDSDRLLAELHDTHTKIRKLKLHVEGLKEKQFGLCLLLVSWPEKKNALVASSRASGVLMRGAFRRRE